MRTTNKILIAAILIAVLLVSIGYAAVSNITLNIGGTVTGTAEDANFKVKFLETTEVSDSSKVTATVTNDTNAAINVVGLTAKGQSVTATYTVQNVSTDLSANLSVNTTNNNEEYFVIDSNLGKTSLVAGEVTTLVVTVELIKTPITTDEVASIGIGLTAEPVQPGEEGSSGSGTGGETGSGETTTLASVTTANIGDYIDLRNNIVGTSATTDDWRILYADENAVYAILADYLPNSTNYAVNAGLDTMGTYGVYSNENRDTLLTALITSSNWNHLANGISGATVTGGATAEQFMLSYYIKTGLIVDPSNTIQLDPNCEGYDIYVPQTTVVEDCKGYWMLYPFDIPGVSTGVLMGHALNTGLAQAGSFDDPYLAIRPVVELPFTTPVIKKGDVWTIPESATNGQTNGGVEKEETTGPIQTTLATVTNANIGEYIDLGNNVVGGTSTSDDWRILYVENNKVYAILADYLPNSTNYAKDAGLDTDSTYNVYSSKDRDTLLNGLTTTSNWHGLANGISGATVTGTPTAELLMKSYNTKNRMNIDYTTKPGLYMAYMYTPHIYYIDNCFAYWLASPDENLDSLVWRVNCDGCVSNDNHGNAMAGVRPVVCLSSDTSVVKEGKLWTVAK